MEECLCCFEILNDDNKVEYPDDLESKSPNWHLAKFCEICIAELVAVQFHNYVKAVQTTDCARHRRKLLDRGPPVHIRDENGFPEAGDKEVAALRKASTHAKVECKLDGCLEGEDRMTFWKELKSLLFETEGQEE